MVDLGWRVVSKRILLEGISIHPSVGCQALVVLGVFDGDQVPIGGGEVEEDSSWNVAAD